MKPWQLLLPCSLNKIGPQYPRCLTLVARDFPPLQLSSTSNKSEQPRHSLGIIGANIWKFPEIGIPLHHPNFNGISPCKPSILGIPIDGTPIWCSKPWDFGLKTIQSSPERKPSDVDLPRSIVSQLELSDGGSSKLLDHHLYKWVVIWNCQRVAGKYVFNCVHMSPSCQHQ